MPHLAEPAPLDAPYQRRPIETWDAARDAYLSGCSAQEVCDRSGLGLSAFRKRARQEGWRRIDQPGPDPDLEDDDDDTEAPVSDATTLTAFAWRHLSRAIERGRSAEAQRWLRVHAQLTAPERARERQANTREAGYMDGLTGQARAIAHVCDSVGLDPEAFRETDREVRAARAARAAQAKVHKVHRDSVRAPSPAAQTPPDPDRPPSRAERRRMARLGRSSP